MKLPTENKDRTWSNGPIGALWVNWTNGPNGVGEVHVSICGPHQLSNLDIFHSTYYFFRIHPFILQERDTIGVKTTSTAVVHL